ncbi:MAG: CapA family protein [Lachnospiraceae bacterium]|nr:CapA family protein [Lachnospiraceae bacterium]
MNKLKKTMIKIIAAYLILCNTGLFSDNAFAKEADGDIHIIMVGDVLMHDKVIRSGLKEDGTYDFSGLFKHVDDEIRKADIAIVNQETILGGEELKYTGYPSFNSPFEVGDAEAGAGFDVILQGTNHALDRGAAGIEKCLGFWESAYPGMEVLGIHDSEEDRQELCIINCKGVKLAILNYTYGTNGIQMPKGKGYLVDYLSEKRVREDIARAEREADITIVCPHWGNEYSLTVSEEQKKWTEIFLDCGVDLVIGTHPHVIEPVEIIRDDKGHEMPVYYSLGNFVNATSGTGRGVMNRMVGGMAEITIKPGKRKDDHKIKAEIKPVVCHLTENEVTAYFLEDYTERLAADNLIRRQDSDFSLSGCNKLTEKVWGE